MAGILADILSLFQYHQLFSVETSQHRLERCLCCGKAKPHRHGGYPRKADRTTQSESLNPVIIQRYYCPECQRTCSVLPECLPPRRWYLWEVQQVALLLLLAGKSIRAIAKEITPSRRTISRWLGRFKDRLPAHKDALCSLVIDLGRTTSFSDFWQACLGHFTLAKAMRLCAVEGVPVP